MINPCNESTNNGRAASSCVIPASYCGLFYVLAFFLMVEILLNPAETNATPAFFPFVNGSYQQPSCLTHTLLTYICMCSDLVCSNTILHINTRLCLISGPGPEPGPGPGNYMIP